MRQDSQLTPKTSLSYIYVKYYNFINIFLILAIIALGAFFMLRPKYQAAKASMDLGAATDELFLAQSELNKLDEILKAYSEIADTDKEKIVKMIPDQESMEKLFPLMEAVVARNGLILASLKVEEEKAQFANIPVQAEEEGGTPAEAAASQPVQEEEPLPPEVVKVKISMTIGGTEYKSLKSLLKTLENSLRIMDVTKMDFKDGEESTLEVISYYLKSEE